MKTDPNDTVDFQCTNQLNGAPIGGLTKLEYFSISILSGIVSDNQNLVKMSLVADDLKQSGNEFIAAQAVQMAKDLIAELNKNQSEV